MRADGRRFWADVALTRLQEMNGQDRGFAAVIRDMTDRHRADEVQRQETEHLSAIIRTQSDVAQTELEPERLMNLVVMRLPELTGASGAVVELVDGDEMVYAAAPVDFHSSADARMRSRKSMPAFASPPAAASPPAEPPLPPPSVPLAGVIAGVA